LGPVSLTRIDTVDREASLLSEGSDVGFDRVVYAFAVVPLPEGRHQLFPLDLSSETVGQLALEVIADLSEILVVLDCNNEQKSLALR
jgi:hypothetical protein